MARGEVEEEKKEKGLDIGRRNARSLAAWSGNLQNGSFELSEDF